MRRPDGPSFVGVGVGDPAMSEPTDEALANALAGVYRCHLILEEMKAIRWIMQWPPGHAERPKNVPDFVRRYERTHALQPGNSVQG